MDPDRSAAQFHAVDHDVVMLAADFFRVGFEKRNILGHRRGERMMAGIPAVLFVIEAEQREIRRPTENRSGRLGMVSFPCLFKTSAQ